jgi:hypothetical protein
VIRPGLVYDATMSVEALETFYTSLLVLSSVVIFWFSGFVVFRLFKGQR